MHILSQTEPSYTYPTILFLLNTLYYLFHYQNANCKGRVQIQVLQGVFTASTRRAHNAPITVPLRSRRPHSVVTTSPHRAV